MKNQSHSLTKLTCQGVLTPGIMRVKLLKTAVTITIGPAHTRFTAGVVMPQPFVVTLRVTDEGLHNNFFPHYKGAYTTIFLEFDQRLKRQGETVMLVVLYFMTCFSTGRLAMCQVREICHWPPTVGIIPYSSIEECCSEGIRCHRQ